MVNSTFISVPLNVDDPVTLRRFLETLVLKLDEAFGNRGNEPFATESSFNAATDSVTQAINDLIAEDKLFVKLDGSRLIYAPLKYATGVSASTDADLANVAYVKGNSTNNPKQSAISDIAMTAITRASAYDQAEAQSVADELKVVADKVDTILSALRSSSIIS